MVPCVAVHQSDIVTVVDFDATIKYISPNCERLLGFRADELIGSNGTANIHPDDLPVLLDALGAPSSPKVKTPHRSSTGNVAATGSWLWLKPPGASFRPSWVCRP